MLKKYKILTCIILFSLFGIVGIMGVWLLDNYRYRREMLVSDVDRGLFNSIQAYYDQHQKAIKGNRHTHLQEEGIRLARELRSRSPFIDTVMVVEVWDSLAKDRFKDNNHTYRRKNDRLENMIMPGFMLQNIDFNQETIKQLDQLLVENLESKGITFAVTLESKIIANRPIRRSGISVDKEGNLHTRPVMVNPTDSQFIVGKFKEPRWYILGKMSIQILLVLLIVGALIGAFVYLMWTINRQNKMALLRKSFVNNMTHELKTPVATVMAAVEAIQRYSAKDDKVKTDRYLQISQRELNHLAGMIDKVLRLDIDEAEGIVLQKDKVDINKLLTECGETAKLGSKKEVVLQFHLAQQLDELYGDYGHLKNVFNNILDNAIKYSEQQVLLDISTQQVGHSIAVTIQDNGIGIDPIYQKDIFDMFFRVPHGHLHPVKGFGLGLPYVKQVVEQHGGQVKVESKLERGSCFTILIPIQ